MSYLMLRSIVVTALLALGPAASAQVATPLSDKVMDLAGQWKHAPGRGAGGICGVSDDDVLTFDIVSQPPAISIRSMRTNGRIPLDGSSVNVGVNRTGVASTDAGWLKITTTQARSGGFVNVMQEVYILNRDRSQMTLWRTLNTVLPDGSSGKIDCGNRAAVVYVRQTRE
jgi:hypothetical protein